MKKILCLFLSVMIAFGCVSGACALDLHIASANLPTMYISGQGSTLRVADENGKYTGQNIFPVEYDIEEILKSVNLLHQPFAKGVLTGNWDEWCDTFVDIILPLLEPFAMDENGNSTVPLYFFEQNVKYNRRNKEGKIDLADYQLDYDWRADPIKSAEKLYNYTNRLLKNQNYGKINIVGRCIGGNVMLAYLANYDLSNVSSAAFYCAGFEGFEIIGKIFTGDITFDQDALSRFADDYLSDGEYRSDELFQMVTDLISVLNAMDAAGVLVKTFDRIYDKVYSNVIPRLLRKSFGTMPSFWALVGDEYYEDAKKFIFGDEAETTYASLIEKTDNYHYNYLMKYKDIIQKAMDSGVKVYNVVKYGLQIFPIADDNNMQSDTILETHSASAGADCCSVNTRFTDAYVAAANPRYLSPDYQIDASACLLPEHTWFIKDNTHIYMPGCIDRMIAYILDSESYLSAPDCEKYPQFLLFDKNADEVVPLTKENSDTNDYGNFFTRLFSFFKHLFSIVSDFIDEKIESIKKSNTAK